MKIARFTCLNPIAREIVVRAFFSKHKKVVNLLNWDQHKKEVGNFALSHLPYQNGMFEHFAKLLSGNKIDEGVNIIVEPMGWTKDEEHFQFSIELTTEVPEEGIDFQEEEWEEFWKAVKEGKVTLYDKKIKQILEENKIAYHFDEHRKFTGRKVD